MTNYAALTTRVSPLKTEFGYNYAVKLFGQEAIDSLPKFVRGKNTGKPKGNLHWRKAEKGGWSRDHGMVVSPGLVDAWIAEGYGVPRGSAMVGQWLGRSQPLGGMSHSLHQEGRDRHAAEQTRLKADQDEMLADWRAEQAEAASLAGGQ